MRVFAVFSQAFAVVGEHRQECPFRRRLAPHGFHQPPEFPVGIGDFAVVRAILIPLAEGGREVIRDVRVIQMHPEEEWFAAPALQPADGPIHRVAGAACGVLQKFTGFAWPGHVVIVNRETLVESAPLLEHYRTDEGGRIPPALLQPGGQRRRGASQHESSRVPHFMGGRIETREDAGMRRRRQRCLRHRILEQHAAFRDAVQGRGFDIAVTVAAEVVGTEGVDGDDDDIERPQVPRRMAGGALAGNRRGRGAQASAQRLPGTGKTDPHHFRINPVQKAQKFSQ